MAVFVTGATGLIGGAVAARLVAEGFEVRGLVRAEEKARQLAAEGIAPVLGNLDDAELLTREARASEGVVNAADSDQGQRDVCIHLRLELPGAATRGRSELNWRPKFSSMLDWIRQEG
jgi:uncharacterized protein YbjT (DUF2867 family)